MVFLFDCFIEENNQRSRGIGGRKEGKEEALGRASIPSLGGKRNLKKKRKKKETVSVTFVLLLNFKQH